MKDSSSTRITTALAEIKALCERATPGPWKQECFVIWSPDARAVIAGASALRETEEVKYTHPKRANDDSRESYRNAAFIAASRETIERLVKFAELATEALGEYNDSVQSGGMIHYYAESTLKKLNSILTGEKP